MTLLLALLLPVIAFADNVYDFEEGGIYYKIVNDEASVTYKSFSYIDHDPYYESDYAGDVVIPASVTYDGKTYPVTSIGSCAFYRRRAVTSITIPSSITSIGWSAFFDCTELTRVTITDMTAWCNIDNNSNPLYYAQHLYLNDTEVTDLTIPDGITTIKDFAFAGCVCLTSVAIPNSVTSIGTNAFEDCTGLTSVTIGNFVTEIGPVAFEGCTALTSVTLGNAVTTIGGSAFAGCTALTNIEIPNSVTNIGINAFSGCTSLASATIGKCVTSIGGGAFKGCEALTSIDIPNSVTSIGGLAFSGCTGLTSLTLGNSIATIGKDAFQNDPAIETITCKAAARPTWEDMSMFTQNVYNHTPLHVPVDIDRTYKADPYWGQFLNIIGDVSEVMAYDFEVDDIYYKIVDNEASVTYKCIAYLYHESHTVSGYTGYVTIPATVTYQDITYPVTSINEHAFDGNPSLTSITLPNSITSIGNFAFRCAPLTSIIIPGSVTDIGYEAFVMCYELTSMTCMATTPPTASGDFFNNYSSATLYVPASSVNLYKTIEPWKNFSDIQALSPSGDVNGDGETNIGDTNSVIDVIINGGGIGGHSRIPACDVNGDGEVNIADVNAIIELIIDN